MNSRIALSMIFIGAFLLIFTQSSYACSCELQQSNSSLEQQVKAAKKKSKAVFSGEVLEINESPDKDFLLVSIRVRSIWKGVKGKEIVVVTGKGKGDCGYPFQVGKNYLVYAYKTSNRQLATNICQRTALLSDANKDILILDNL